jgi:hypothetical protein
MEQPTISCTDRRQASPEARPHRLTEGTWTVQLGSQHQLVQYGTCAIGVGANPGSGTVHVGNQDIIDLINTSINKFSYQGKVGAKGVTSCQGALGGNRLSTGGFTTLRLPLWHV